MSEAHPMMVGAATVFVVSDIAQSTEHYRDALGFTVTFQYGNPTFYVCLCRDEVALHLLAARQTKRLPGNGAICIFVKDVDAVHAELVDRGARVVAAVKRARAEWNWLHMLLTADMRAARGTHVLFQFCAISEFPASAV